jgi:hypothetical protein
MRPVLPAAALLAAVIASACGSTPVPSERATEPPAPVSAPVSSTAAMTPAPSAAPSTEPGAVPPDAALLAGAGDPVRGQLGSYVWRETGSDSPWLPGSPVTIEPGRSLRFGLSFEVPVTDWSARYAPPGEPSPGTPVGLVNGAAPLEVTPPPSGDWTLALTVTFGQGLGSATWYWRVRVP